MGSVNPEVELRVLVSAAKAMSARFSRSRQEVPIRQELRAGKRPQPRDPLARRWRRVVDDYHLLRLLGGEKQGNQPADEGHPEEDIDDDNSRLVRAISLNGRDGGQKVYV